MQRLFNKWHRLQDSLQHNKNTAGASIIPPPYLHDKQRNNKGQRCSRVGLISQLSLQIILLCFDQCPFCLLVQRLQAQADSLSSSL